MINPYYKPYKEYPDNVNVTVTENRAPTDESVKLLSEFEEAVKKRIETQIHVSNNAFNCKVYSQKDYMNMSTTWVTIFMLNGKRLRSEYTLEDIDQLRSSDLTKTVCQGIMKSVGETIATEVLMECFKDIKIGIPRGVNEVY